MKVHSMTHGTRGKVECLRCGSVDPERSNRCGEGLDHVLVHSRNVDRYLDGHHNELPTGVVPTLVQFDATLRERYPSEAELEAAKELLDSQEIPEDEEEALVEDSPAGEEVLEKLANTEE